MSEPTSEQREPTTEQSEPTTEQREPTTERREPTTEQSGEPRPAVSAAEVRRGVEAVLLVADQPVTPTALATVLDAPVAPVQAALEQLAAEFDRDDRGWELRQVAGGWRVYTRADCADVVERWLREGQQARLTQAALETLAVVAYRQPVTRARISAVRGVNVDGVVRTLLARGLLVEAGQDAASSATTYRTTVLLLEKLGLQSLDELPSLAPLLPETDDLEDDSSLT